MDVNDKPPEIGRQLPNERPEGPDAANTGSIFMPTFTGRPANPMSEEGNSPLPERPVRILVADDEYLVALDIVSQLEAHGYTPVGPVSSGSEAVRLARAALPDMAVLDVRMPDGDGISAAKTIFQELRIPVVILSAYTDEQTLESAKTAGVFAYLVKPSNSKQLRVAVEVAWRRFREFVAERQVAENAQRRLDERKIIERAKWALVQRIGVDEASAMRMLEEHARSRGEPLMVVAERVVSHGESALRLSGPDRGPFGGS